MKGICVVGGMGCGKTTVLGLLDVALTSYAIRNREKFKFSPDLESTAYLSKDVLVPLQSGQFPKKTAPGSREEVKLIMKLKKTLGWKEIELNSYDIAGEDITTTLEELTAAKKNYQQIIADVQQRKTLRALLESDVFVFVVDSLACDPTTTVAVAKKKAENDQFLQQLWLAIKEYKKRIRANPVRGIALLFAKYDQVNLALPLGEVNYYSLSNLKEPPDIAKEEKSATKTFEEVVQTYLPFTYAAMDFTSGINRQNLKYFRSGIVMTRDEQQLAEEAPIGIPLTFSANEFIRMALWLSEF
jgi:hypothetical protein